MDCSVNRALQQRECGFACGAAFSNIVYKRCSNLRLSGTKCFERSCAGPVTWLALDPQQHRYLLAAAADSSIAFFDTQVMVDATTPVPELCAVARGQPDAHRYLVSCVLWYPVDTGLAVSGSYDQDVKLWDTNMLTCACKFSMDARVSSVSMSPCASSHCLICVTMQSTEVKLCDPASGAFTHTLVGHREFVRCSNWSASSPFHLATGDERGQVRVWDIRTSGCMATLNQYNTAGDDNAAQEDMAKPTRRRDPEAPQESRTALAHDGAVTCIQPTPDGLYWITCATDSRVRLWCSTSLQNQLINYPETYNRANRGRKICTTVDGRIFYHPSGSAIQVFDLCSGAQLQLLRQGHFDSINCCEFNSHAHELYTGANDALILVWDSEPQVEDSSELLWDRAA